MTRALRCSVCKTHKHLYGATAEAYATGPLDADSVECQMHLGGGLDVMVNGAWCRWRACLNPCCQDGSVVRKLYGYCAESHRCEVCAGVGGRYVPVSTANEPFTAIDVACRACHAGLGTPCRATPRYGETAPPSGPHPERRDTLTSYLREQRLAVTAR